MGLGALLYRTLGSTGRRYPVDGLTTGPVFEGTVTGIHIRIGHIASAWILGFCGLFASLGNGLAVERIEISLTLCGLGRISFEVDEFAAYDYFIAHLQRLLACLIFLVFEVEGAPNLEGVGRSAVIGNHEGAVTVLRVVSLFDRSHLAFDVEVLFSVHVGCERSHIGIGSSSIEGILERAIALRIGRRAATRSLRGRALTNERVEVSLALNGLGRIAFVVDHKAIDHHGVAHFYLGLAFLIFRIVEVVGAPNLEGIEGRAIVGDGEGAVAILRIVSLFNRDYNTLYVHLLIRVDIGSQCAGISKSSSSVVGILKRAVASGRDDLSGVTRLVAALSRLGEWIVHVFTSSKAHHKEDGC